jgi:ATP-dependent DNA ligase
MTPTIRPMLASTPERLDWPRGGLWVQPKYDGLRCLIDPEAGPVLRSGEPIPCPEVREALSDPRMVGFDGELTAPGGLEAAQSTFTSQSTPPEGWRFTAFDDVTAFSQPFAVRLARLRAREAALPACALISPARFAATAGEAAEAFAAVVSDHREQDTRRSLDGLILRSPIRAYREGRTTAFRGEAMKLKPASEGEAFILDLTVRRDDRSAIGSIMVQVGTDAMWVPLAMPRDAARRLHRERDRTVGRQAVLRWWGITAKGKPRSAFAVAIRRDLAA